MKYSILLIAIVSTGCSILQEKAAPEIAAGINKYCEELSPAIRAAIRAEVNARVEPGTSVVVTCPGDE